MRRGRGRRGGVRGPIPLLAHGTTTTVLALAGAALAVLVTPERALTFQLRTDDVPRPVMPAEYLGVTLGLVLALSLASRFHQWDRFGPRKVAANAVAATGVVILAPCLAAAGRMALVAHRGWTPMAEQLPGLNNVVVLAALAAILVGLAGRGPGAVGTLVAYVAMIEAQNKGPAELLPLTWGVRADATLDEAVRWPWILALIAGALALAWVRRGVPLGAGRRSREE